MLSWRAWTEHTVSKKRITNNRISNLAKSKCCRGNWSHTAAWKSCSPYLIWTRREPPLHWPPFPGLHNNLSKDGPQYWTAPAPLLPHSLTCIGLAFPQFPISSSRKYRRLKCFRGDPTTPPLIFFCLISVSFESLMSFPLKLTFFNSILFWCSFPRSSDFHLVCFVSLQDIHPHCVIITPLSLELFF